MFAVRQRKRWAQSATPKPCPRSSKHWGIIGTMFAVRQRGRWANSATPKPCPALIQALGDRSENVRRAAAEALGANSATPKPCPRSSKHWGMTIGMFAVRQRRRW
jgi:hypothetical protein